MGKFQVTGEWIMRGTIEVEADSAKEAEEKAYEGSLPPGEYAKGTFEVINVE